MTGYNKKIGGGGFHHVAIKVRDFDKTLKFYVDGLGFEKSLAWGEGDGRGALLDTGDGNFLEVFAGGKDIEKPEGAILHFALRTDDCDLAVEQARKAGAIITTEPTDVTIDADPPTPVRYAFAKGLDGEMIEFFQNK